MTGSNQNEESDDECSGLLAAMAIAMASSQQIKPVADACPDFLKELRSAHPIKAAATFGALLTQKQLQPNCLRLEMLVHLCVAVAQGSKAPTTQLLTQGYAAVGQACGHFEDPPEDIFVGNISSKRGNYLVIEGIWESGTFFLQRFVNLVDSFPEESWLASLADSVHALLKLSDIVCTRAGLVRNELGSEHGERRLPRRIAERSNSLRKLVRFELSEIQHAGIDGDDLDPFLFNSAARHDLLMQALMNTDLEAQPLAFDGKYFYLLLPTAVSMAVRRLCLRVLASKANRQLFLYHLGLEYSRLLQTIPALRKTASSVKFSHFPWGSVCSMVAEIDEGRFLNMTFFLDTLEGYEDGRFSSVAIESQQFIQEIENATHSTQMDFSQRPGFKNGITIFVICGIGRGLSFTKPKSQEGWEQVFISAPDFCTLSSVQGFKSLDLWRLLNMQTSLKKMGVHIDNMNGLLNLYAWADSLEGHLVPHADIPEEAMTGMLSLSIVQNSMLALRHRTLTTIDAHSEQFIDATWLPVVTEGESYFEEDAMHSLYGHDRKNLSPLGACITPNRCWWYELESPPNGPSTESYDRWRMLGTWLPRAAHPLELACAQNLGAGAILWRCIFTHPQALSDDSQVFGTEQDATNAIHTVVHIETRTIEMHIAKEFDLAIFNPENIAERTLVAEFVRGVAQLAGISINIEKIVKEIVPNSQARHSHMFASSQFRDFLPSLFRTEPTTISRFDDASTKLGLGWRVRNRSDGGKIEGKQACQDFLNALVTKLEDELCEHLRTLDRTALLSMLLLNHELSAASRERWHRTAAANLALRTDKASVLRTMRKHETELNGVSLASRNLIEVVLCESPMEGGRIPGDFDLSQLMLTASLLFHMGGWSDLIRWDMLEPIVVVRPLGDVHIKHDFMDEVLEPFGNATSANRYSASAENYAHNLNHPGVTSSAEGKLDAQFLAAWQAEFDVEFDAYRRFIDAIEDLAIRHQEPVIKIRRSELIALADNFDIGLMIVNGFCLTSRGSWRQLPDGYTHRDIALWRFRRRLSLLRRPILQLTEDSDPLLIVAPGLLREGFVSTAGNYFYASYPDWHLGPAMKRYAGYARNRDGMSFNTKVSDALSKLGWQTDIEIPLTKILGTNLDRNYGDVDVLAWDSITGRVLIVECKDLQFRKTYGEIAEQLCDFLGEISSDGRRDYLRKHLDRVHMLQKHIASVGKYLKIADGCKIEGHLVFSNTVPMQFSRGPIKDLTHLHVFSELNKLDIRAVTDAS